MPHNINWVLSSCITQTKIVGGVTLEKAVVSFEARVGADNGAGVEVPPRVRAPGMNPAHVGDPDPETFMAHDDPALTQAVMLSWLDPDDRAAAEAAALEALETEVARRTAAEAASTEVGLPPAALADQS